MQTGRSGIKVGPMSHVFHHLGLKAPIFQAPMAGAQNHRLALAVCHAGGLGAFGVLLDRYGLSALPVCVLVCNLVRPE
jgi:IMP dehydrogenase/GMP reductase